MKKTKGKVLSLILASAMIVSSFSSMMGASAATARTETGSVSNVSSKIYLVSGERESVKVDLKDLIGDATLKTYDKEIVTGDEIVRISHVKESKLLKFHKDGQISVKAGASGKEVINVRYEAEFERDEKDVTVRASKDITVYVDENKELFLAKAGATDSAKRPGDLKAAAVNEKELEIGLYYAVPKSEADDAAAKDKVTALYKFDAAASAYADKADNAKLKSTKVFEKEDGEDKTGITVGDEANTLVLQTTMTPAAGGDSLKLAKTGKTDLQIKLGKQGGALDNKYTNVTVEVAKKWNADIDLSTGKEDADAANWEIGKRGGKTYLVPAADAVDFDDKDDVAKYKDSVVGSYTEIFTNKSITVLDGSVGNITATSGDVIVEKGNIGDVEAATVTVENGSVGTINGDDTTSVEIQNGRVKAIDTEDATVAITGGSISGDVVGNIVNVDAEDDDINTVISGKVTVKGDDVPNDVEYVLSVEATSDASVEIKGAVKASGPISLSGTNVVLNTVDADYDNDVKFEDFFGTIKGLINAEQAINLINSKVVLTSKVTAEDVDVDEDSKLTVSDARVSSISGEGVFAFTANKLFVEDAIDSDTILEISNGLAVGETALQSMEGVLDVEDLTTRGFTLETKSASKDVDKHIIKAVQFAGVKFDKTELTIAKGYSDTLTVASYPTGTSLPAGATVEWNIDANDDYITMTVEGNVATIKAVDFSADRAIDNEATITATVVDADGIVIEDLMEASVKVSAVAVPASEVTLDTNKPVALGTGAVYQYIANSSTKAVLSATSSDTQVATVALFNAADARGYKFQINALKEGTAVITTTDANGASKAINVTVTKVNGSLKADTTSYTFAPGAIYDVKFSVTGSTEVPVVTVGGKVVSIAPRGNGVYRITAQNAGTAFVVAKAGNTHVSIKFDVVAGAAAKGVTGNNVSLFK